jgi:hypothetical protein
VRVERRLLGHRGQTERTAYGDAPEGTRRPPELTLDDRAIVHGLSR